MADLDRFSFGSVLLNEDLYQELLEDILETYFQSFKTSGFVPRIVRRTVPEIKAIQGTDEILNNPKAIPSRTLR